MKRMTLRIGAIMLMGVGASCESGHAAEPKSEPVSAQASGKSQSPTTTAAVALPTTGVRSITLPTIATPMPTGPGYITFSSICMTCHTPRYVLNQPAFPRKTWVAEVEKMKKVYGAPISDEQIEPVVNYLMTVRGNGQ